MIKSVAVLGAGMQGSCVALELAERGFQVDLFDRNSQPITQAGLINEGKVHLGYVYANDPAGRTAEILVKGALEFAVSLRRWIDFDPDQLCCVRPFVYAVPHDSMRPVDVLAKHFRHVDNLVRQREAEKPQARYMLRGTVPPHRRLGHSELSRQFDTARIKAAFETGEYAVNTRQLAKLLRKAMADHPNIRFHPFVSVCAVKRKGNLRVSGAEGCLGEYPNVINALWDGRETIDRQMGLPSGIRWQYRYKYAIQLQAGAAAYMASVTYVLGPYGDVVNYDNRRLYLSWYPVCRQGLWSSADALHQEMATRNGSEHIRQIKRDSLRALASFQPTLKALNPELTVDDRIVGGVIVAAGDSDIDRPDSGLHRRDMIGIQSQENYHSVFNGKFTMAPALAIELADRVESSTQSRRVA